MLLRLALAAALLPLGAGAQELRGGLALTSEAGFGWTSNAEGMAGGRSDTFIEHRHAIALSHASGDFILRGALSIAETRYDRLWQENDRETGVDLALDWQAAPDVALRATAGLAFHEDGQALPALGGTIAALTPYLKGHAGAALETRFGDTALTLGLRYRAMRHDQTTFGAPGLVALRTRPDSATFEADMRLAHALNAYFAVTGLIGGLVHTLPDADRADYGRVPVKALRVAVGAEAALPMRAGFALEAGADIVWPDMADAEPLILPYMRSQTQLALGAGFDLRTDLATRLDFDAPADGLGDWFIEGRTAIGYAPDPAPRLEAALFASAVHALGLDIEHKTTLGGELSATTALGEVLSARASLAHTLHSGLAPDYEETRMRLTIAAAL